MNALAVGTFLSGALMSTCVVACMFFLRFYKQTADKFFLWFALAFFMLGVERFALLWYNTQHEERTYVYLIRLMAFLIIIFAILNKNRPTNH